MNHYLLSEPAKKDGYIVEKIEVPHIGEDYGKVVVYWQNGEIFEAEISDRLAVALKSFLDDRTVTIPVRSVDRGYKVKVRAL